MKNFGGEESCQSFYYPSPDTNVSTSPSGGEVLKHVFRPQCAPDATEFLSDVYKRSTRAQKFLADGVQCGRSMIEMLGVLAIVGVLSVGGIAGYSKAMMKWKINKTIEQVAAIVTNIKTLYAQQKGYSGLDNESAYLMGIIPEVLGSGGNLTNPFGGLVEVNEAATVVSVYGKISGGYYILYRGLPKDACIALITIDWNSSDIYELDATNFDTDASQLGLSAPVSNINVGGVRNTKCIGASGIAGTTSDNTYGKNKYIVACPNDSQVPLPVPPDLAAQACDCEGNTCAVGWKYY